MVGVNAAVEKQEEEDYLVLKDVKLELKKSRDGGFSVCFWLYLSDSPPTTFPSILLSQMHPDFASNVPFLMLSENKLLKLFPVFFLHHKTPAPGSSSTWADVPCASAKTEFPLKKWVHVGCQVSFDCLRLYVDGDIVGEMPLTSSLRNDSNLNCQRIVYLAGIDGSHFYVHGAEVFPLTSSIKNHRSKDPPIQLSIDSSSASEIEEDSDGVWSIVGGKASCRRNFSLDVVILDAFGQPVNKEMEVVASLLYADDETPVEKPDDAEAPLLISYDGIEFASYDRPSKLINGRASFKLKISQLSSKCDNRLFCIQFGILKRGRYPFLEVSSRAIRCISRSRNVRMSPLTWKKSSRAIHLLNGSQSSGLDDESSELLHNVVREAKASPSSKRIKLGQENPFSMCNGDILLEQADEECNSQAWINGDNNASGRSAETRPETQEETDNSDTESSEATKSDSKSMSNNGSPVSDLTVFKYCLGGLTERFLLLKEIAMSASNEELIEFAEQVSLYTGCSHHRHQILIAKRLIEEGTKAWNMIAQNNQHVLWENLTSEMKELFAKLTFCSTRLLTHQDFELLRKVAGCQELVAQEHFEKMWCWLYPVVFTLSKDWMNALWKSTSPKWIEGLITKEEAESSLQGPGGLQEPGTFILRFPTSRSWPHPDAGNLIVTYVGSDYTIHNRLLSLDFIFSSNAGELPLKALQDMLLEEPELSRLGKVIRSHQLA